MFEVFKRTSSLLYRLHKRSPRKEPISCVYIREVIDKIDRISMENSKALGSVSEGRLEEAAKRLGRDSVSVYRPIQTLNATLVPEIADRDGGFRAGASSADLRTVGYAYRQFGIHVVRITRELALGSPFS